MLAFPAPTLKGKLLAGAVLALVAWVVPLSLDLGGVLEGYSLKTLDLWFRVTPLPAASPEVVVITLGQPDLDFMREQGVTWPWPRQLYAPIVDFCRRGGARAVIFDVLYTEESVYGQADDQNLAQAIKDFGRVFLPFFLTRRETGKNPELEKLLDQARVHFSGSPPSHLTVYQGVTPPIGVLSQAAAGLGNVESTPDRDGVYRRVPLLSACQGRLLPILSFGAYSRLEAPGEWRYEGRELRQGHLRLPVDDHGRLLLKFRGPSRSHRHLSAANVIQSEVRLKHGHPPIYSPEDLKGKWVLVGFTAPGLMDLKPTPLAPVYPGVEIHATLLDNLLKGDFLRPVPAIMVRLAALVWAGAATLAVLLVFRLWVILGTLVFLGGGLTLASLGLFCWSWWADPVLPAVSLGLAFALAAAYSYATEGRQKQVIRRLFAQYMSEKVIAHLLAHPELLKLGGERRRVTLYFSDLAGFTSLSERLNPEEVVGLLNDYLSRMTDLILEEEGTVDKFEGDAIMAFWGAPLPQEDQALRACRTALRQQAALAELNRQFSQRGLPPLNMRIGIHTGEAVVGNLGSQSRFDYTVIGDTVNLASRLEGLNKFYGTQIIASEVTREECQDAVEFQELDLVAVKGREMPVRVYQVLALKGELTPEAARARDRFAEGLRHYREQRFSEAASQFRQILQDFPENGPALAYLERCRAFLARPPAPDWDGVFRPDKK
jgi:adenylate cyclase